MSILRRLYLLSLLITGCNNESFKLRVDDAFYIKTIDRVVVTGSVLSGVVKPGDHLMVRSGGTTIPVTVERLEHPRRKLERASKGDPVGLVLLGIRKEQVKVGDSVEAPDKSPLRQ